jgi:hypothetical protein
VSRAARAAAAFVPASLFAAAALVGAVAVGAEPPAGATEERTVCEWVVEPRYIANGPPKLEPQRVCRTETVRRPGPPAPPADLRPARGGTGIIVASEPAKP